MFDFYSCILGNSFETHVAEIFKVPKTIKLALTDDTGTFLEYCRYLLAGSENRASQRRISLISPMISLIERDWAPVLCKHSLEWFGSKCSLVR